jgi:hypothetical protein
MRPSTKRFLETLIAKDRIKKYAGESHIEITYNNRKIALDKNILHGGTYINEYTGHKKVLKPITRHSLIKLLNQIK